ncbi:MAG TPA: hypothetical protein VNH22_14190 [Blastocatellia bacterium]|jgi:hypothetical protein|nr:hypothetical protein [Blastocatellia bacterium]
MKDFLTRLAERTLMISAVARPVTAPVFAPTRGAAESPEGRGEDEQGAMNALLEMRRANARDLSAIPGGLLRARPDSRLDSPASQTPHPGGEARGVAWRPAGPSEESGPERDRSRLRETLTGLSGARHASAIDAGNQESRGPQYDEPSRRARTVSGPELEPRDLSSGRPAFPRAVRPLEISPAERSANGPEAQREAARQEAPPAPIIKVSIGRIEVRAVAPHAPPAPRARPRPPGAALTLNDYLKQRDEGKR